MFGSVFAIVTLLSLGSAFQQDEGSNSLVMSKLLHFSTNAGNDLQLFSSPQGENEDYAALEHNGAVGFWKKSLDDNRKDIVYDLVKKTTQLQEEESKCSALIQDGVFAGKALLRGTWLAVDTVMMSLSYINDAANCEGKDEATASYICYKTALFNSYDLFSNSAKGVSELVELTKKLINIVPQDFNKCRGKSSS